VIRYVESLNQKLHALLDEDKEVYIVGEDLIDPYGGAFKVTKGLSTRFPERVITTPISEAGFTGLAIGMSLRGLKPIVEIMFGDFTTLICDQLLNHALKFSSMYNYQVDVPLIIRTPMGGRRGYGPTHSQTIETIFLNAPELTVVAPSIYHEPGQLLYDVSKVSRRPVLFIENKLAYSQKLRVPDSENDSIEKFQYKRLNKASKIYPTVSLLTDKGQAPDITLICYGGMAPYAAEAAQSIFESDEVNVEILLPSLIKPLPLEDFADSIQKSRKVLIVEEAPRGWGWGAELSCRISEEFVLEKPPLRIGALETSIPNSMKLEKLVLPQTEDIVAGLFTLMD